MPSASELRSALTDVLRVGADVVQAFAYLISLLNRKVSTTAATIIPNK